jgi:hypothetical protein
MAALELLCRTIIIVAFVAGAAYAAGKLFSAP